MSNQEKIADIIDYRNEQTIYEVTGKLTKLYDAKETQHGSLQNGEIEDETGKIKITFLDAAVQEKSARNKTITIRSTEHAKHGWTGAKLKKDEKYGDCIWVTSSAEIEYPGSPQKPTSRRPQSEPERGQERGQGRQPERQRQSNQYESLDRIIDCYHTVHNLVNEKFGGKATDQQVATVFIEAGKAMVVANWVPGQPRKKTYPPAPKDPSKWRECVIPKGEFEGKTLEEIPDNTLASFFNYYDSKDDNGAFAECVYKAAEERGLLKTAPQNSKQEDSEEDDIPF